MRHPVPNTRLFQKRDQGQARAKTNKSLVSASRQRTANRKDALPPSKTGTDFATLPLHYFHCCIGLDCCICRDCMQQAFDCRHQPSYFRGFSGIKENSLLPNEFNFPPSSELWHSTLFSRTGQTFTTAPPSSPKRHRSKKGIIAGSSRLCAWHWHFVYHPKSANKCVLPR